MAATDVNLADRSGNLVESHKGYDPRIIFFYFVVAALLVTLVCGLAYQQLFKTGIHNEAERQQNQRRVLVPGPRGNIYDRNGRLLVGNRPVFSVVLYIDELRAELLQEYRLIHKNYLASTDDKKELPSPAELWQIARVSVAQRYLDQVNHILQRDRTDAGGTIDAVRLQRHFSRSLLLPYTLLEDLSPADYAKLIEELPVNSPLQVYSSSQRYYPFNSAAAHTLGYVRSDETDAEDFPGDDLMTFKLKGATGKGGLELQYDDQLQGTAGGSIFRVDPSGYRINPPLEQRRPKQGKNVTTSLDIDLQQIAEDAIGDQTGVAVAVDVATGEILVLASKPDYDLNKFSPHATAEVVKQMNDSGAWTNLAVSGLYPPGSTFKTVVTIAGLRSGKLDPNDTSVDCEGALRIGNRTLRCDNGDGHHGRVNLSQAIAESCDSYFWWHGTYDIGAETIAAEARRFHLDRPTGIDLPTETKQMIIPDAAWLKRERNETWTDGYTANMSIGQGDVLVTPLEMACYAASLARGETYTKPTLIHDPNRPRQHTEPIGLTPSQRAALINGMVGCTSPGKENTAYILSTVAEYQIPGVTVAGKTGTAQKKIVKDGKVGNINYAWFICFAPVDHPQIAMAVMLEGDTIGETFSGGMHSAPVAALVMKKYFEKQTHPDTKITMPFNKS